MSEIILSCKGLTKRYGTFMALNNLNLTLESGRIIGLLGPNGSGKSTLIKMAAGLLSPGIRQASRQRPSSPICPSAPICKTG